LDRTAATDRPRPLEAWLALALFLAYAVLFYRDVLLHDRVYIFRDLLTFFYSLEHVARRLAEWDWPPQWNPFIALGRPFAADPLAGVYYPPHWLLRQLPVASGFNLSLVVHHAWGSLGAFLLARHLGLALPGALLAGLLYGFAGPMVSCDNVYNGLLAAAWGPWVLLACERWCARPSFAGLAAVALALAMSLLGAMPEFTLFTNLLALALVVERRRRQGAPAVLGGIAALAAANLLALALCGVQTVPAAELVAQSPRADGLNAANALQHSLAPERLLAFVRPQRLAGQPPPFGGYTEVDAFHAPWMLTLYFGPALALALLALARRECRPWALLALVFLALALGRHLPGYAALIERFDALRMVRYPEKFLIAVHGLAALGAGAGLDAVRRGRSARLASAVGAAVLLLTGADLYRANGRLLPSASWAEVAEPPASLRLMQRGDDPLRIYGNAIHLPDLPAYPEGFLLEKDLLLMETANLYDVANLNAPTTITLDLHEEVELIVETLERARVAAFVGSLNTAYVTSVRPLAYPGLDLLRAPAGPLEGFVYRVAPLAPRAFVPRRAQVVASPAEALERLRQLDAPAEEVLLLGAPAGELPAEMRGRARLRRYQPERVELALAMETAGVAVLSDTHFDGWTATLDGVPAPILAANRFARAVWAPPGEHTVVFEYMPRSHRLGLALTLAATLVLALAPLYESRSRRLRRARAT